MIALGADHGGFLIKEAIRNYLEEKGIEYKDFGTYDENSVDYPEKAKNVATFIKDGNAKLGILCCGTGIGISIAANKVKGIRAAVVTDEFCAEMTRRHNDANILCLGGRVIDEEKAVKLCDIFLNTEFEGDRHIKRLSMIEEIENNS